MACAASQRQYSLIATHPRANVGRKPLQRFVYLFLAVIVVPVMLRCQSAAADGYPTLERVDYVLTCMKSHGGQTVDNLYACSCEIDIIAQQINFEDFSEARTFEMYKRMPGEKGGIFRDSSRAAVVVGELDAARADGERRCFIGRSRTKAKAITGTTAEAK